MKDGRKQFYAWNDNTQQYVPVFGYEANIEGFPDMFVHLALKIYGERAGKQAGSKDWDVSEKTTGLRVNARKHSTRASAIDEATSRLNNTGRDEIDKLIQTTLEKRKEAL